jgi:putative ABC transport system permease protein
MDKLLQDLRYALRSLMRQPGFAATAILTLALGIGATAAIFTVVNAVVIRPLPYREPDRMVAVMTYWTKTGRRSSNLSAPDFYDLKAQSRSFEAFGYWAGGEGSVTVNGSADYAGIYKITPEFFDALGARARVGRLPSRDEQKPGGPLVAVITYAFWQKQFNGDPRAVGSTIKFDDRVFTIGGVLEPGVRFPPRADIYYPSWLDPETTSRSGHNYRVVARLRPGITVAQAHGELTAIAARLEQQYPNSNSGKSVAVVPLQELLVGGTRQTLLVLFAAVGLVLLIACANVANLLLARATARQREMVVRAAVGAGRGRLVRQLLTESAVLGVAAGLLGMWLARLGVLALAALAPADLPRQEEIHVDATVLAFALVVALVASFLFGLAPALQASRVHLADSLRQGGKGASAGSRSGWARNAFVIAEVALAVVLVFGAGLLGRSLAALASVDMGFAPEKLLVLRTAVPVATMADATRATAFYRNLLGELRTVQGVTAMGGVTSLPTATRSNGAYWIEGGPGPDETGIRAPQALFTVTTPDYFKALGVPFKSGRDFNDGDRREAPFVAIINQSLARASFPDRDPIGRRIRCGLDSLEFMTIVGVVADVRTEGPAQPAQPELYMPFEQHPGPASALNLVARTSLADPLELVDTMTRKIRARNPDVPVSASTMETTLSRASSTPRFRTFLLGVFAGVALLLAVAGVYGVMSYSVTQRMSELGVRVALGASPQRVMALVLGEGAKLAAAGLAIGLALALLSGRVMEGLLFGVTPSDPLMLLVVSVAVAVATLLATYIPGRRAVRVDPAIALRAE